ncbi:putative two-component sensor kinase [Euzebya pacifica]|uniref:histidine kinase n=2 Tax=Euzebya pacifica TaxID=1608957 RepID=A0A346Y2M0_9ACTN|nr:ATP-binding protein [Euzebya pacifica]AXV08717.1 putative two-component sensor kinase [Euzebya pacifica]
MTRGGSGRRSLRARVTATAAVVVTFVLLAGGAGLVLVQQEVLLDGIDDTLVQRADDIEGLLGGDSLPDQLASRDGDDALAQVVTADGDVLLASPVADGSAPLAPDVDRQALRTIDIPVDDEPFRVLSRPVVIDAGPAGTAAVLHVATTLEPVSESRMALVASLAVGLPVTVLVLCGVVWWVVGRTLRPVAAIQRQVAAISGVDLGRRVPEPSTGDEIAQLARLMNDMLDRLESAAATQRQFTSDAAHELRSPLTRLRAELEVDLAHPETVDHDRTTRRVLHDVAGMQALVDDLLFLARHDEADNGPNRASVDLLAIAHEAVTARRDGVAVEVSGADVVVDADRRQVVRAIRNLVDNAVRHARSQVTVEVGREGVVTVTDDGPGIPFARAEEVFGRFVRLDEARSAGDGGAGLGLAISRGIARAHGGDVVLDTAHVGGARMVLRLAAPRGSADRIS